MLWCIITIAVNLGKIILVAACTLDLSRNILMNVGTVLQGKMIGILPRIVTEMEKEINPTSIFLPQEGGSPVDGSLSSSYNFLFLPALDRLLFQDIFPSFIIFFFSGHFSDQVWHHQS